MFKGDIILTNPVFKTKGNNFNDFNVFSDLLKGAGFNIDFDEVFFPMGSEIKFVVVKTIPEGITQITDMTELELLPEAVEVGATRMPDVTYEDIGGLGEIVPKIREMIELPLRRPEVFERLGVEPPKGVLLHGSPGTGKTLIAKAVANESGANFILIAGPEIMSKWYGGSEENLRNKFDDAEKNAPSIIFIDEIDAIAPKREELTGEVERRVVSQLLTLMDGLKSRGKVVVIAATNRPNALDPALRRGGRFDREIEIPVPDKKGRKEILQIHSRRMPLAKDVDLDKIADVTYGYVGADIASLAKEAGMHALRRVIPEISALKEDEPIPKEILEKLKVTKEDFDYALRMVPPSAMREVLVEISKVKWEDVGGLEDVKEALKEAVEWPIRNPECFKRIGVKPPKGILLYGPPGVGKTYIVKALANETGVNLVAVKGPEILTMWVGESERKLRDLFRRAKQVAPSIILFDEIDALAPKRGIEMGTRVTEQVVSQLLTELSGIEEMEGVSVIATTNRPDIIDPALLRPGRFDRLIYVPAPDEKTRLEIFKVHTREMPLKGVSLDKLAKETDGYSGADIEALCREAALFALRDDMKAEEITMKNFEKALKKIKPSITEDLATKYQKAVEDLKKTKMDEARYIG
jgi:transitional endoplasmic reticulum ATPase